MNALAHASAGPVTGPKLDNRRVLAGLIDLAIVSIGAALILGVAGELGSDGPAPMSGLGVVILGWSLYYYFACESSGGQTVGKRLLKLRVVRVDGSPAGMREVAVRTVLRVVDGIAFYLVGLVVMLVTGERRGRFGDLAGGTMVADASAPADSLAPTAAVEEQAAPAVSSATITLPPRPAAPPVATPAVAVPELRPFEPELADEPVEAPAPVEEPEAEVVEPELVEPKAPLADMASPSLQELAQDVAGLRDTEPEPQDGPEPEPEPEPAVDDEPVTVTSVETVSAIDLVMGEDEDDASDPPAAPRP